VTAKVRKRDLRTRVTYSTFDRVKTFAVANQLTTYAAIERLVLLGLDAGSTATNFEAEIADGIRQLSARIDLITALTDRALFCSVIAFAYARHVAISSLEGDSHQALDHTLTQYADGAYARQRSKALGD
jgi:hypothetical protein